MKYSGDAREIDLRLGARNGDAVIEVVDHGLGMAPMSRSASSRNSIAPLRTRAV
jgi:signal transduction histidine kinase